MKKFFPLLLVASLLTGCATPGLPPTASIELSAIERLEFGKTSSTELRSQFGSPDRIVSLNDHEDTWLYNDRNAREPYQRASFLLDRRRGILLGAAWIPGQLERFNSEEAVRKHFQNVSFRTSDVGWVAAHEFSSEKLYEDPISGISFRVRPVSGSVVAIGFGIGQGLPFASRR